MISWLYYQSGTLLSFSEIIELQQGKELMLVHLHMANDSSREEVIMRVQGYLLNSNLPPIRSHQ